MQDLLADVGLQRDEDGVLRRAAHEVRQKSVVLRHAEAKAVQEDDGARTSSRIPVLGHAQDVAAHRVDADEGERTPQGMRQRKRDSLETVIRADRDAPVAHEPPAHYEIANCDSDVPYKRPPHDAHRIQSE